MKDLEKQIAKLKAEKKEIEKKLKPLEAKLKQIKKEAKSSKMESEGFSPEMIQIYALLEKIPSKNKAEYMSWSIDDSVEKYFEELFEYVDLQRYDTYYFSDIMDNYIDGEEWAQILSKFDATISQETLDLFKEKKLKELEILPEKEQKGIRIIFEMFSGITSDYFKWDW